MVTLATAGVAAAVKAAGASDALVAVGGATAVGLSTYAVEWWRAISTGNDQAVLAWRFPAIEEEFRRLGERIGKIEERLAAEGNAPEPIDPLRTEAVFSEFAKGVSEARSPDKRLALVNAAAHQFDPALGNAAMRAFWFARVKALSDMEIVAIGVLAKTKIALFKGQIVELAISELPSERYDANATMVLQTVAQLLCNTPGVDRLVFEDRTPIREGGATHTCLSYAPTPFGKLLATFIE